VSGVVVNDTNQILLLKHRFRESDSWQLPGGFVGRGETPEEALVREIQEETGYAVRVLSFLEAGNERRSHVGLSYLCRIEDGELRIRQTEILEARFFSWEELPAGLLTGGVRDRLADLQGETHGIG
jgi:mutator protein MutT